MKINLIATKANIKEVYIRGKHILEMYEKDVYGTPTYRYAFLDPVTGISTEIAPEIGDYSLIPVTNCIWQSDCAYLASCREQPGGSTLITILRHDSSTSEISELYSYNEDAGPDEIRDRIRIFIFPGNVIIIQKEEPKDPDRELSAGNIFFSQTLVSCDSNTAIQIKDKNLIKNGINTILPVSQTHMMLKTGFSYPDDERFRDVSKDDALIEGVYYGITSSFISSAPLESTTTGFEMIATAYYTKNILKPHIAGDYINFTIVDLVSSIGETIFYNFKTGKQTTCQNLELDIDDMRIAYVINNIPYIRQSYVDQVEFINLQTSETDCVFYDEKFSAALGDLLIFSKIRNGKKYLRGYRLPKLDLVFETRGTYAAGCKDEGKYYIYVSTKEK